MTSDENPRGGAGEDNETAVADVGEGMATTEGDEESASAGKPKDEPAQKISADSKPGRQLSISLRSLLIAGLVVALVAGAGVLAWLYVGAKRDLDAQTQQLADMAHAEQIALDYATAAAAMNFKDINAWKAKLVEGTSQELKDRLTGAADQMEQILVPLQWDSTARPLAAKVRSTAGSAYTVDAFVSVLTKTVQGPDPLQSTATYSVTIDSDKNWQITDVGGIDAAVTGP